MSRRHPLRFRALVKRVTQVRPTRNVRAFLFLAALVGSAGSLAAQQQSPAKPPVNPVGDFEYSTTVDGQVSSGVFSITKKDDVLTGKILTDMMPEIPITSVKVEGRTLTFTAIIPDAEGQLVIVLNFEDDDKFTGNWSLGGNGASISGKRKTT